MKLFHPPHIYHDKALYFITARTVNRQKFFNTFEKKNAFLDCLSKAVEKFNFELSAWVLLINHYHIILKTGIGNALGIFINNLHANSARNINNLDNKPGRQVWYQYWDRCIRSEKDLYTRLNYIHHNPVKHKEINKLENYQWSSYNEYINKHGIDWVNDCFKSYPIIDFTLELEDED